MAWGRGGRWIFRRPSGLLRVTLTTQGMRRGKPRLRVRAEWGGSCWQWENLRSRRAAAQLAPDKRYSLGILKAMHMFIGSTLLALGLLLTIASQWTIAFHALGTEPLHGVFCFIIPLYVFVYARKHKVGTWLLRAWYIGVALIVVGGVVASS